MLILRATILKYGFKKLSLNKSNMVEITGSLFLLDSTGSAVAQRRKIHPLLLSCKQQELPL